MGVPSPEKGVINGPTEARAAVRQRTPTDAAFDAVLDQLGADAFGALTSDPELLRTLLLHHVVEARITSDELTSGSLTMLDGTDVDVDADS